MMSFSPPRAGFFSLAALPLTAAILAGLALLCGPLTREASGAEARRAALALQWQPQAQFAGFYAAQAKGFYREAGVEMEIIPGGPDVVASELLKSGRAQFATMFLATGLERRAEGLPVVHLAQLVQSSALMLLVRADSPVREPKDLDGRRVGLWDNEFRLQPRALFRRLGITPVIIPQSDTLTLFLRGGVEAASGMWYNEYHTLLASGLNPEELRVFFYRDLELNFPEDGLYALEKTADADPELCRAVVAASLRGWKWAFEHPDEALDIVMDARKKAHLPASRAHQRWMLARMKDVMQAQGQLVGRLERADFDRVARELSAQGLIRSVPDFEAFNRGGRLAGEAGK